MIHCFTRIEMIIVLFNVSAYFKVLFTIDESSIHRLIIQPILRIIAERIFWYSCKKSVDSQTELL